MPLRPDPIHTLRASSLLEGWARDPGQALTGLMDRVAGSWPLLVRLAGLLAAGALLAALVALSVRRWRAARLALGARQVVILAPPEPDPAGAAALWSNLRGLLHASFRRRLRAGRPHVTFEYAWNASGLRISMWVPGTISVAAIVRAVEAAWPGCRTRIEDPVAPLPVSGAGPAATGRELRLAAPDHFGLRSDHRADPLRALLGAAAGLTGVHAASVQLLARPAGPARQIRAWRAARHLRTGASPTLAGALLDAVTPGQPARKRPLADDPARAADTKAALAKLAAGPGYEVAIRVGATAATRRHAAIRTAALVGALELFRGRNYLRSHRTLRRPAAILAARRFPRGSWLTVPELAALAHLPWDASVPGLARAGAKAVPPPPEAPRAGKVLGDSEVGIRQPVAIQQADARFHVHLMGATGSGKSTMIANLVLDDATNGRGAVVIDPKGDLVNELLERLPVKVAGRTVVIDPADAEAPPAINVLEGPDVSLAVDHLIGILHRVFPTSWGPRLEDVLRSACLTLLRRPGSTLASVPKLLTDDAFRRPYLKRLGDPILAGFWDWYLELSPAIRAQIIGPIVGKLRAFLLRPFISQVVDQATSSFDMTRVLDGGLLLARVPKGVLGEEASKLLGSFVVARTWQAVTTRASLPEAQRRDASLYVDEAHNFLNLPRSLEEMLAEARGYRLSVVLAHHHLDQLTAELRGAIATNARTKVWFASSPDDARALERHVAPALNAHDLSHLGAYQAAVRLVVGGVEQPACTIRTRPAPEAVPGRAELVRERARARFGRPGTARRRAALQRDLGEFPDGGSSPPRPTDSRESA